jgi:hypothetical protein
MYSITDDFDGILAGIPNGGVRKLLVKELNFNCNDALVSAAHSSGHTVPFSVVW